MICNSDEMLRDRVANGLLWEDRMFMDRIEAQPSWSGLVAVRLLRRWVAIREMGQASLPALVEFGNELEISRRR